MAQNTDIELVVINPFPGYEKGQIISDAETIEKILEGDWAHNVIKKAKQAPADPSAS